MDRLARRLLYLALLAAAVPLAAQRLPDGELQRNRERHYDLRHLAAELRFNFEAGRIDGRATLELAALRRLGAVSLDAYRLEVSRVILEDTGDELPFELEGHALIVHIPGELAPGETVTLGVDYAAAPRAGMYFQRDPRNPEKWFVHTYGEGGIHANWLPLYNDVDDKLTSEMAVTVPRGYVAISNGELVEETDAGGEVTYRWRQDKPHPSYLISIYTGDFERGELAPAFGEIPLAYWVPRGRLAEGAHAFRNTTRMVEHFSDLLDYRYPWVKYDQVAVPDYAVGAMEHTGVTGHNASVLRPGDGSAPLDFGGPTFDEYWTDWSAEATIAHELAHHWFGDNTTCRSLSHLWLNESFASYLMMLWDEESVSEDQLLFDLDLARRHYFDYVATEHRIRPLEYHRFDAPDDIYNTEHTYLKGAAVLHMLRRVLGDEPFFHSLTRFLEKHEYGSVESRDLAVAIQEASGVNLDWFFADWVTGGGHPVFEVESRYLAGAEMVDLTVRQVQPIVEGQGLFRLPVEVTVQTARDRRIEVVWVEEEEEHFLLPAADEPLMVSFDGAGDLVAEIRFGKSPDELAFQAREDRLGGRLRALRQLAERFPTRPQTIRALRQVLEGNEFWGLQAEAALLLGEVRTPEAEKLLATALDSPDYRVRKAAALALPYFGTKKARQRLRRLVAKDPSSDVAGTAIVALARAEPGLDAAFLRRQLARDSWYDEIRIAALTAAGELERPELAALVEPYARAPYNQDVRRAALTAWKAASPTDPALRAALLATAQGPPYALQRFAIEKLGELYAAGAEEFLEELAAADVDANLTQLAREALTEIERIEGAGSPDAGAP